MPASASRKKWRRWLARQLGTARERPAKKVDQQEFCPRLRATELLDTPAMQPDGTKSLDSRLFFARL